MTLPYNLAKAGGTVVVVVYMMMIIVSVSASQTWLGSSLVFWGFLFLFTLEQEEQGTKSEKDTCITYAVEIIYLCT